METSPCFWYFSRRVSGSIRYLPVGHVRSSKLLQEAISLSPSGLPTNYRSNGGLMCGMIKLCLFASILLSSQSLKADIVFLCETQRVTFKTNFPCNMCMGKDWCSINSEQDLKFHWKHLLDRIREKETQRQSETGSGVGHKKVAAVWPQGTGSVKSFLYTSPHL